MRNQNVRPLTALLAIVSVIFFLGIAVSWASPSRSADYRDQAALQDAPAEALPAE